MDDSRTYLPPEWKNEDRIRVLMGPMPPVQDVVARNARLTFWTAAIHSWCKVTKTLTFNLKECLSAFRRGTQEPHTFPDVLVHMNSLGEAIPLDDLPRGERSEDSWVRWGQRVFISGPLLFGWSKVKQVVGANNLQGRVFVNTRLLQEMCDNVLSSYWKSLSSQPHSQNKPLTLTSLYEKVEDCVGSVDNLYLVIDTLAYNGRAAKDIHRDTVYVKFAMPGDTRKPVITQMDIAEDELESAQARVEANITQLSTEINSLQQEVVSSLKAKSKTKALSSLRKKKRVEKSLATHLGALENITSCLLQLQETQVNKQVLGAFRVGVEAIRDSVAGVNSADNVATTMDDLQEVLTECQDVSSLLATGLGSQRDNIGDDDDALSEELEQLVLEDQPLNQINQNVADSTKGLELPEVPKNNPIASLQDLTNPLFSP